MARFLLLLTIGVSLNGCDWVSTDNSLVFTTRRGMGIDKWASIWLIKRHISPNSEIHWLTQGDDSDLGVRFDVEDALYKRTGNASTFKALVSGFNIEFESLPDFMQLVHDVEINYWGPSELMYSDYVEGQFRRLQQKFGQENTPMACYLVFFDNVAANLFQFQDIEPNRLNEVLLLPDDKCASEKTEPERPRSQLVAEWPIETVLQAIDQGKKVVFIDVREADEFAEDHIPGAMNVKIRDVPGFDFQLLNNADLVVPYCVKDFRGFEMARLLKQNAVENVLLMRPYGLKGWVSKRLPTAGNKTTETKALEALAHCADRLDRCLNS